MPANLLVGLMAGGQTMTGPDRVRRHRLAERHVAGLTTGGGDEHTISELMAVEHSWRMVMLRAVLTAARSRPDLAGPLPPVAEAWQLLLRAEQRAPAEVADLLVHPQIGTWAGHTLRRVRGASDGDAPLWVEVGYLHAVAAAAATRAGLDFATWVPVRDGFAVFPTLGAAHLPASARWDRAEVRGTAGVLTVAGGGRTIRTRGPDGSDNGASGWLALQTLQAESAGHTLSISLDDIDPYRNLRAPVPPHRLSAEQVRRWRGLLSDAWQLITTTCPQLAAPLARGLISVVPRPAAGRFRTMSASAGDAFGCAVMSEPDGAVELAVTLVHEFQHIKLGGLLHLAPLHEQEPAQRLYAPWRDDPRPLGGLLQGVYAFVGITGFWQAVRQHATGGTARLAQFEFARWRQQVWETLRLLRTLPQLTAVGRRLVTGLTAAAAPWQDQEVPAELLVAADAMVADHRTMWRLHHLRPEPGAVAALAAAWTAGAVPPISGRLVARLAHGAGRGGGWGLAGGPADPPGLSHPDPVVDPDPTARDLDTRAVLTLWRLTDPAGFDELRHDPDSVSRHVTGATAADLAYVAGDLPSARALYLATLAAEPDRTEPWAGLRLVASAGSPGPGPASRALRIRPELVRAVYRQVRATGRPVDPLALAGWLGGAPVGGAPEQA